MINKLFNHFSKFHLFSFLSNLFSLRFRKLILKNEFLKSLLGLCLLLIFYAHSDEIHDLNWILKMYSLHGYSLIKIIQIFLKSLKEINQSRTFIKYLSSIEEIILSSMIFSNDSPLWNEIQTKGILSYSNIHSQQTSNQNLTNIFNQSPNSDHVKRRLFTTVNLFSSLSSLRFIL